MRKAQSLHVAPSRNFGPKSVSYHKIDGFYELTMKLPLLLVVQSEESERTSCGSSIPEARRVRGRKMKTENCCGELVW